MAKKKGFFSKYKKPLIRGALALVLLLLAGGGLVFWQYYRYVIVSNVDLHGEKSVYIYIRTASDFEDVKKTLYEKKYIIHPASFEWLAEKKGYTQKVRPGRYLIHHGMTSNALINLLRSGKQQPLKLTFNNVRTKDELVSRVTRDIEADSAELSALLSDSAFVAEAGFTTENIMCMFLPDTYELYWNTTARDFFMRMKKEYDRFWTQERKSLAAAAGISATDAGILASIVYSETKKKDEMSRVAGVYINRIRRGIPLQADPTVVFAVGDFTIRRVLKRHLEFDSPYNTYKYAGLPPGPICVAPSYVIDAVLKYEKHDYIFFCAKDDFSGYHVFARTGAQHAENARRYQQALNRLNIRR